MLNNTIKNKYAIINNQTGEIKFTSSSKSIAEEMFKSWKDYWGIYKLIKI